MMSSTALQFMEDLGFERKFVEIINRLKENASWELDRLAGWCLLRVSEWNIFMVQRL